MKNLVKDENLGEIVYQESFWTGKKQLFQNGKELKKLSRTEFETEDNKKVTLKGNTLTGVTADFGGTSVVLVNKPKWYEYVLGLMPFILVMIWGNVVALCKIVPIVGGAIGGLISGVFSVLSLFVMRRVDKWWLKVIIGVAFIAVTFITCWLVALAMIGLLTK